MMVGRHQQHGRLILTVCDESVMGKRVEQGRHQLDLTSNFFQGERMAEQQCLPLLARAAVAYFVGKESVALGVAQGIIDPRQVRRVRNIPHAQAIRG